MRTRLACAFGLLVTLAPLAVRADETTAAQLFRAAMAAHARGDFRAAGQAFEEANRHAPHAATMLNAAKSWDAAGNAPRAADDYARALAMDGAVPDDQLKVARARLEDLRSTLGLIELRGPPGAHVSLAHVQNAPLPVLVHVAPGAVEIRLRASEGAESTHPMTVEGGEKKSLDLASPRREPPPAPIIATTSSSSSQRIWSYAALGGGVVASGAAVALGFATLGARDGYRDAPYADRPEYDHVLALRDRAVALRTWTNVAWGAAALLGGTGLVLFVTAPKPTATARLPGGAIAIDAGGVTYSSSF